MFASQSMAQNCSLLKFDTYPDSLNQAKKDTSICQGACLDLYAKLPVLKQTTTYTISNIPFLSTLPCEGAGTSPFGSYGNDIVSPTVNMGFNFCFFGKSYAKCVVTDNGFISFDTTRAGSSCNYKLTTYPTIPTSYYIDFMNSIMGCCMDIFVTQNPAATITVQTVGIAPFRVFIVKYNHCGFESASCTFPAQELDMKILLYETSNIIEVYIKKKTMCASSNGGLAIQGLQDDAGNVGFATPGRNNTQWTAANDAKRFTPSGPDKAVNISWFNGTTFLGSGVQHTVCPPIPGWYRAECSIDNYCNNTSSVITIKDSVFVGVKGLTSSISTRTIVDSVKCYDNYITLDAGDSGISYRWNTGVKNRYLNVTHTGQYQCTKIVDTMNCIFDSLRFAVHSDKVFLDSIQSYGCFAQGLGTLQAYGSGGTGTIQYKIASSSYSTSPLFDSLSYGSYHVKVKDTLGCEIDTLITINRPSITITLRNTCGVDSMGVILMNVGNFNGPYTYKKDTGGYITDSFFTNVKGGSHTVSIKNSQGCVYDTTFLAPFISLKLHTTYSTIKASGCFGSGADGSITVTTTGGNPPYRYSSNYSPYQRSNTILGLPEGTYFVSVRDTFNCGIDTMIQVQAQAHLYMNGHVINASCFNTNTATIVLYGWGGVLPYSFSFGGAPFSSVNTVSNLGAGTMTCSIRDGRGCIVDSVLPIGQPPPIQLVATVTHVSCFGGNDGKVIFNSLGGVAPYTFSKNGAAFASPNIFTLLTSGTYDFRIRDYNLCIKDTTIIINQPFPLNFTIGRTNTSCSYSSDGKFLLTPFGGTAPYVFSFNGGAFTNKLLYDSLAKGTYTVRIKDAHACTRDSIVIINNPPKIIASFTFKTPTCFGSSNAKIKVVAAGGTPPFQYALNNTGFFVADSFMNLLAGNYIVSVKDSKGCLFDTLAVITQPPPLSFNVLIKNVGCFNDSNGEINLSAIGATLPYQYAIDADSFSTNNVFKKKIVGSYLMKIKDANGCIYDTTVKVTEPMFLRMNLVITHVSCYNGNDGKIVTTGIGGTSPYSYRINGGIFTSSVNYPNLTAGTYIVSVADSNNCSFDTTITITQTTRITTQLFITNTNCYHGDDGSFKVRPSGGIPPYKFALDTAAFTGDSVFLNLKAGLYKVYVKDANLCRIDTSFLILEPTKIITNTVIKHITCYNGNDGSITITPGGGTGPYKCSTDSINFTNIFFYNNLIAGNYKFYIHDSKLCSYDTTVTVFQSTLMANGLIVKNLSCFNSNDGVLRVVTSGGSKPYKYSFNGGAFDTVSLFTNLPIGTYNVQTKDTFNCIKDTTVTITQPPRMFINALSTNSLCHNAHNGTLEVSASGGVPPFTYSIGNNVFSTFTKYYNLAPATYTVSIKDLLGCVKDTLITITEPDSFSFSYQVINNTCYDGKDGVIQFSVSGATPPYLYAFELDAYNTDTIYRNLAAGVYTIKVKDSHNCLMIKKITVTEPPKPTLAPPEVVRVTWDNDSTILLQWKKYPRALHYNVESKYLVNNIVVDTFYYEKLPQDQIYSYRVSVFDSCNYISLKSPRHNTLLLAGDVDQSKLINLYWNSYQNWQNGVAIYNIYHYDVLAKKFTLDYSTADTTYTITVKPEDSVAEYIFYVEAVELNGNNATSVSNKVYLYTSPQVWMPNIFSPNNDQLNDYLSPKGLGIINYTVSIYNRWGQLLYKGTERDKGWDGKYEGVEVPEGLYVYEVKADCYFDRTVVRTIVVNGSVMVVR
jgi:gliding motility-associated-like protein